MAEILYIEKLKKIQNKPIIYISIITLGLSFFIKLGYDAFKIINIYQSNNYNYSIGHYFNIYWLFAITQLTIFNYSILLIPIILIGKICYFIKNHFIYNFICITTSIIFSLICFITNIIRGYSIYN